MTQLRGNGCSRLNRVSEDKFSLTHVTKMKATKPKVAPEDLSEALNHFEQSGEQALTEKSYQKFGEFCAHPLVSGTIAFIEHINAFELHLQKPAEILAAVAQMNRRQVDILFDVAKKVGSDLHKTKHQVLAMVCDLESMLTLISLVEKIEIARIIDLKHAHALLQQNDGTDIAIPMRFGDMEDLVPSSE